MKLNILFWNTRDKVIFNEGDTKIYSFLDSKDESFYFLSNHEKIKATFIECGSDDFYNNYLKGLYKKRESTVIVLKEINDDNISVIMEITKVKNVLIISGKCSLNQKNNLKNVVYIPQLYYEESTIEIHTFIHTLRGIYDELIVGNNSKTVSIILGCEKEEGILGSIPLYILKHFNYVSECDEFILNIYGLKELGAGQLIYIEDPLKEYMKDNSKLTIEQIDDYISNKKIYFSFIAR